jgi:hypothetical protein
MGFISFGFGSWHFEKAGIAMLVSRKVGQVPQVISNFAPGENITSICQMVAKYFFNQ